MTIVLYTVHVLICFFLIAVVLLQQGSGADLSVFGGGATQTAFGARGAATVLHKMTVISFVLFIFTTLAIGAVQDDKGTSKVLSDLPEETTSSETSGDEAEAEGEAEEEVEGALPTSADESDDATPADAGTETSDGDGTDGES